MSEVVNNEEVEFRAVSNKTLFCGIDPGKEGGIGFVANDFSAAWVIPMPILDGKIDSYEICRIFSALQEVSEVRLTHIEQAMVLPGQGAVSGLTIGVNYGKLVACLDILATPYEEVRPLQWRKAIFGLKKKQDKKALKEASLAEAVKLFPSLRGVIKRFDGMAEALLIAEAARRSVVC